MLRENFKLKKFKVKADGLVEVVYNVNLIKEEANFDTEINKKGTLPIHPDLDILIKELAPKLRSVHNYDSLRRFAKENEAFELMAEEFLSHISTLIQATGISISGSEEKKAVVITGLNTVSNGQKVSINSNRISLEGSKQGIEEDLERITAEIEEEVFLYLFENKSAELEIPYEEETEEDPDLFNQDENKEDE